MNIDETSAETLTIGEMETWIKTAKGLGAEDGTPLLLCVGKPGDETMLLPLTGITNAPVRFFGRGITSGAVVPIGQEDPEAIPAAILTMGSVKTSGAYGIRFASKPENLYLVYCDSARDFMAKYTEPLLCPPIPLQDYKTFTLFLAREEQVAKAKNEQTINHVWVCVPPFRFSLGLLPLSFWFDANNPADILRIRERFGSVLFRKDGA